MTEPFVDPVVYTVEIRHYHDGDIDVRIVGVASDERSKQSVAHTLRVAADLVEKGEIRVDN